MNSRQRLLSWHRGHKLILALVALSLVAGCATENYNPYLLPGAGIGGALGAGIGALASPANPWKGAAIGGLLGVATGGVAGELYGRSQPYPYPPYPNQQQQSYYQPQPQAQPQVYYQPQQGYYQPQQDYYQ